MRCEDSHSVVDRAQQIINVECSDEQAGGPASVSQSLHFGGYGGVPLKVLWALFDMGMITVLDIYHVKGFDRLKRRQPINTLNVRDGDEDRHGRAHANV
jgi:uncharacterized iron-regulated membrane protein